MILTVPQIRVMTRESIELLPGGRRIGADFLVVGEIVRVGTRIKIVLRH